MTLLQEFQAYSSFFFGGWGENGGLTTRASLCYVRENKTGDEISDEIRAYWVFPKKRVPQN